MTDLIEEIAFEERERAISSQAFLIKQILKSVDEENIDHTARYFAELLFAKGVEV